ncbi:beta-lactamase family protein, partial [Acetobacter fallax]
TIRDHSSSLTSDGYGLRAVFIHLFCNTHARKYITPSSLFPLSQAALLGMTTPEQSACQKERRGFGWDISSRYASPCGELFSARSFGHTGFIVTSLWIDPDNDGFVLILTNRVHPYGGGGVVCLRKDVAAAIVKILDVSSHVS